MKTSLLLMMTFAMACGGQTIGDIDGGTDAAGNDAAKTETGTSQPCTKNAQCGTNGLCGFDQTLACAATGHCFAGGTTVCNGFSPGCACDGTTINVICNGLPDGYVPAPLAHKGTCDAVDGGGAPYPCGTTTCIAGQDICYMPKNVSNPGTCMPANGCTDCACAQAMFQCVSSCKQSGPEIYVQCQ